MTEGTIHGSETILELEMRMGSIVLPRTYRSFVVVSGIEAREPLHAAYQCVVWDTAKGQCRRMLFPRLTHPLHEPPGMPFRIFRPVRAVAPILLAVISRRWRFDDGRTGRLCPPAVSVDIVHEHA
jgi:hypothetical protein